MATGLGHVLPERARTVREPEAEARRERDHVRPVVVAIGDEGDEAGPDEAGQVVREREVRVGDEDVGEAQLGQRGDTVGDGAVQAVARPPQHLGACFLGPSRHLVVVADDVDGQRPRGGGGGSGNH